METQNDLVIEQAVKDVFKAMSEKSNVEDYPCKDTPCQYWWVRYAVACTYLKEAHDSLWQPKLDELRAKYGASLSAYQGQFNWEDCGKSKRIMKFYLNRRIIISWNNQYGERQERAMTENSNDGELFQTLDNYLRESEKIKWGDCPYQMEHQSVCPFYKASEFYKQYPVEVTSSLAKGE